MNVWKELSTSEPEKQSNSSSTWNNSYTPYQFDHVSNKCQQTALFREHCDF